ncbi:hypothetical protein [Gottfriedia solisilvae]|uniref:Uncharacterized protein n=1 Tax=Gottfriedia solisilvae TaxID=1516104 RepID=A0A8J3EUD8_9BACI|nr:hypothetical protein [Gottfriedia solisilvae]GGI11657.1 hypothetical protein GCM10007380_08940 [Gottfriedia solisilvae]
MKKKSIIIIVFTSFLLLAGVVFYTFVQYSNPIQIDGGSWTTEGKKEIVYQFYNKGLRRITIKEVTVNHGKKPNGLALGISYGGRLVQPVTDDPDDQWGRIKFVKIDAVPVYPRLNPNEINEAIHRKDNTLIYYGIKMEYKEPIQSITVKYTYFGLPVTKKIKLESWGFWNVEN